MTKVTAQLASPELLLRQTKRESRPEPRLHGAQPAAHPGV